jgi:hypothetical protein
MFHSDGKDGGSIHIGTGPSNYSGGSLSIGFNDLDTVVDALGGSDPKIIAITARIQREFAKLEAEAPAAVKRIERKEKARRKAEDKARQEKDERLTAIRESITPEERDNYRRVVLDMDPTDTDSLFRFDDRVDDFIVRPHGNVEPVRDENGHLIVATGDGWRIDYYDITAGTKQERKEAA